jgi:pyruvate dehydrogenase E1 component beta subunit
LDHFMPERQITFAQAVCEATAQAMQLDPSVVLIGQGTRDAGGIFGTVSGLFERHGPERVIEMPLSENALTGVCMGAALAGLRPVYVLQRADFLFLTLDQLLNHVAKWRFTFGGKAKVPLTIRAIIGKGWGQGPQHSQSPHATLAHYPGLRVVMPAHPSDAKGLLLNSIFGDDPVLFLEARALHGKTAPVAEEPFVVPFGRARVVREGSDVTLAALSYLVPEAEQAAEALARDGIQAEVIDLVSVSPVDWATLGRSVEKTGRLVVADLSWAPCGFASEISAEIGERFFGKLRAPVARVTLPFHPTPTAAPLEAQFYPRAETIAARGLALVRGGVGAATH